MKQKKETFYVTLTTISANRYSDVILTVGTFKQCSKQYLREVREIVKCLSYVGVVYRVYDNNDTVSFSNCNDFVPSKSPVYTLTINKYTNHE